MELILSKDGEVSFMLFCLKNVQTTNILCTVNLLETVPDMTFEVVMRKVTNLTEIV